MDKCVYIVRVALKLCVTSHLHDTDNICYHVSNNPIGWIM